MVDVTRRLLSRTRLSPEAMDAALSLSGLRPGPSEWRDFGIRAMRFAGILSLAAGIIFLIAFNWDDLGLYARFGMVELPLLAALGIAWTKGLDRLSGKLSLMLAVLLAGGLLALFGQTYQTGADVYELFFGWAALTLPWVIACRYAPCWALWLLLLNLAVGLYADTWLHSWLSPVFSNMDWSPWFLPVLLNLLLYVTVISLGRWPDLGLSENWLRRAIMAVAMMFGTFSMLYRITSGRRQPEGSDTVVTVEVLLFLVCSAAFAVHAFVRKEDLFNFAVLALSWIAVTTTMIGKATITSRDPIGPLLILSIYVIATSAGAVKGISYLGRQWKTEEAVS
jgi:uncharacterized membrane protein